MQDTFNDINDILSQDPEFKKQLIREMISEDKEFRERVKESIKESIIKESRTENPNNAMTVMTAVNETVTAQEESKPSDSLVTGSEKEKLYEILNKINSSKREKHSHSESKEEKYAVSDLFTTMVVFGEKIGQAYSLISYERKNSNLIIKDIKTGLENLSEKMNRIENKADIILGTPRHVSDRELLAKKDIEILNIIDDMGKACADDIKEKFGYKNRNAASARLNRLEERGLLKKQYAGRTVYYTPIPLKQ